MAEAITYHIRRPLRPARGNQFYRDESDRGRGTYCKAPETDHDISHRDKARPWVVGGVDYEPCADCSRIRQEEQND